MASPLDHNAKPEQQTAPIYRFVTSLTKISKITDPHPLGYNTVNYHDTLSICMRCTTDVCEI